MLLQFKSTLALSFVSITAVFISFGVIGYLAYGDKTNAAITMNLPEGWTTYAVQVSLSIGLMFTFPVMMVPVYEIADRALDATEWWEKNLSPLKQCVASSVAVSAETLLTSPRKLSTFIIKKNNNIKVSKNKLI